MISVIITTCKREFTLLRRAIDSVLAQTYRDWELIIVDDTPPEDPLRTQISQAVATTYSLPNVRYVQNEENRGACYSRNRGLAMAAGEYIAYLDDDDEWLPDKLQLQYEAMCHCSENTALLYCPCILIDERTSEKKIMGRRLKSGNLYCDLLIYGNYIGGTSLPLMRTALLKSIGGFDEQMQSFQDYDVWLRLAQKYEITYITVPLVNYYMYHGEQITTNPKKQIQGGEQIIEKNKAFLMGCNEAFWARTMLLVPHYATIKKPGTALKLWVKTVAKCPMKWKMNCMYLYSILIRIIR